MGQGISKPGTTPSAATIVRAWKDPAFARSLPLDVQRQLPPNPAGRANVSVARASESSGLTSSCLTSSCLTTSCLTTSCLTSSCLTTSCLTTSCPTGAKVCRKP